MDGLAVHGGMSGSLAYEAAPPPLANLQVDHGAPEPSAVPPSAPEVPQARPPGGVLVVAVLSAASGAVMGLALGGHLGIAATLLIGVSLGVAVGVWARSLADD